MLKPSEMQYQGPDLLFHPKKKWKNPAKIHDKTVFKTMDIKWWKPIIPERWEMTKWALRFPSYNLGVSGRSAEMEHQSEPAGLPKLRRQSWVQEHKAARVSERQELHIQRTPQIGGGSSSKIQLSTDQSI